MIIKTFYMLKCVCRLEVMGREEKGREKGTDKGKARRRQKEVGGKENSEPKHL